MLGQSSLPDPSQGQIPDIPVSAILTLLAVGFFVGGVGHLYRSSPVIALGMLLIVIAVIVLPFVAFLTGSAP